MGKWRVFDANCQVGRHLKLQPHGLHTAQHLLPEMDHFGIHEALVKESRIVYYSREPLEHRLPGEAPDVASYEAAIPWIAGAVQILLDKTGRVKAFTWNGEEQFIHSTDGDWTGASLSLLDETFFE